MKSPSLDTINRLLKKHILLAESYTEQNGLAFIIKACRLKPYSFIFKKRNSKIELYRWWFDEFGNSLKIVKNKRIKIIYNDLSLNMEKILCTDLYYGLSIDQIAKISKLVFIYSGKDEDLLDDVYLVSFLGLDNYLRTYLFMYGEWQQVSSLLLGMNNLKTIARSIDIKYFLELNKKENIAVPCHKGQAWLSFMPVSSEFFKILEKHHDGAFYFLQPKKGS